MVVNVDMAGQQGVIGDNDVIAQLAVVGNMAAGHKEIMTADPGKSILFFRGPIDSDALADDVVIADDDFGIAAAIAYVLGIAADDGPGIDMVVTSDGNVSHQGNAVFQPGSATDGDVRPHDAVGAYFHFVVDLGPGINSCVFEDICRHSGGSAKSGMVISCTAFDVILSLLDSHDFSH